VSRGHTVCCFPFKCMCRGGILFVDLRSCVSVEGHTVCCFPFKCKCRGGILFVDLRSCLSVEGAYCLLIYVHV